MIDALVGLKGTGKTARLAAEITEKAHNKDNNIVCIEAGKRFDRLIPYTARLVDIEEFPVEGYGELLAFIAGMISKDYDITHIYIDSIYKVASEEGMNGLAEFIGELDDFARKAKVKVTLTISEDPADLPAEVRQYIREQ